MGRAWLVGRSVIPVVLTLAGCHLLLPYGSAPREDVQRDAAQRDVQRDAAQDAGPVFTACCSRCQGYKGGGQILWPTAAAVQGGGSKCQVSSGGEIQDCPAWGVCSATFFRYGGCLDSKDFEIPPGFSKLVFWGCSDGGCAGCPACTLSDVLFEVQERSGPTWVPKGSFGNSSLQCSCQGFAYTTSASTIRVVSTDPAHGFYLCVFVEG